MSDSEDDNYVTFGVPLDPLDEENVPRKKPVTIEDQYAYDAQGRRRFHGAFTGGFSAGYFNTVGTRDGWRPQQFKSSRSSKADNVIQRPEDFMDEEDTSQFGIAPKGIRTTSDYADHGQRGVKRERVNRESDGPIPGTPVLKELLKPVRETVGITLLKKMGWRPGQGVGSRITKKEKAKIKRRNEKIRVFHQPDGKGMATSSSDESEDDHGDVKFAPDDYEPFRCNPKDNFFGIGYSGLERRNILSDHINLFDAPAFSIQDKNKKLSIHGQAFGVGAFEADDEDIYAKEDMSRYDFALGPERKTKSRWSDDSSSKNLSNNCLEGFVRAKDRLENRKVFPPPELPKDFVPKHAVRKSRFYPPIENIPRTLENGKRKDLTATDRARILGDTHKPSKPSDTHPNAVPSVASNIVTRTLNLHGKQQVEERQKLESQQAKAATSWMDKLNAQTFVKGGIVGSSGESSDCSKITEESQDSCSNTDLRADADEPMKEITVKPFLADPDKQRRFEQYLDLLKKGEKHKLESIQPLSMTEWDREQEHSEFEQAVKLVGPSAHCISDRFTHASDSSVPSEPSAKKLSQDDELKQAVKMKMFGKLTRERIEWKPASIVCKRFNIPEPKGGCAPSEIQKRSTKFSIFDSLDWSSSTKFLKATDTSTEQDSQFPQNMEGRNIPTNLASESKFDSESSVAANEPTESISEKMKNFKASYEKIFGKSVQEVPIVRSSELKSSVEESAGSKLGAKSEEQVDDKRPVSQEVDTSSGATPKNTTEEKKDLFKAIFLSSSDESESEPEPEESVDSEAVKSVLIGKVPSEMNTQRNTSPPRGIFAKVDLDSLVVSSKRSENTDGAASSQAKESNATPNTELQVAPARSDGDASTHSSEVVILPDMYGPALPARLIKGENKSAVEESTSQNLKPVFRSVVVPKVSNDSKISGKWVERSKVKKSKKEKKKHKHKEHRSSKHKRKSKKDKR